MLLNSKECLLMVLFGVLCLMLPPRMVDGATPASEFKLADGFEVELVYDVSAKRNGSHSDQGSWVALTVDPQGRFIASDQTGGLYRLDPSESPVTAERLQSRIVGAQGLLCAFGSLYVSVNSNQCPCGVWRLTDTNDDGQYDQQEHLIQLNFGGEHGPHGLALSPNGKRIFFTAGNYTGLPQGIAHSRVPKHWGEDHLIPQLPDAGGHAANLMAPAGYVASFDPSGDNIELVANGFRNPYDLAFDQDGELFTFDADMEWDFGTPWYRPTRICHVISGAEFGWRNGTGKWPSYWPDSFGPALNVGPGSPTGTCFGYETRFPPMYRDALFVGDWSYGNIYAVHLSANGSSYQGTVETFASAAPLPITDLVVHPDGMLYFTTGGRGTQSALYRIGYSGPPNQPQHPKTNEGFVDSKPSVDQRKERLQLEKLHASPGTPENLSLILDSLGHQDRGIQFAARVALEHQPIPWWKSKLADLPNDEAKTHGVLALARSSGPPDAKLAWDVLMTVDWETSSPKQRLDFLRTMSLVAIRMGGINADVAKTMSQRLRGSFPSENVHLNRELARMLVYLDDAASLPKIVAQLQSTPDQQTQLHYALTLRVAKSGWTLPLQQDYLRWFHRFSSTEGGHSYHGFLANIKKQFVDTLPQVRRKSLAKLIHIDNEQRIETQPQREWVQRWTTQRLIDAVSQVSEPLSYQRGKTVFAAGKCFQCHQIHGQGGRLGPILTSAGGKFSTRDMIESIVAPSQVISNQYASTQFLTKDGELIVGKIVNLHGSKIDVMTNLLEPAKLTTLDREDIETQQSSSISMMPAGLLDTFTAEEVAQLIGYLKAGGAPQHPSYSPSP